MTRGELHSLQPGQWANDAPVNFFVTRLHAAHREVAAAAVASSSSSSSAAPGTLPPVRLTGAGASHAVARLHMWKTEFVATLMKRPAEYVNNAKCTKRAQLSTADVAAIDLWLFPLNVAGVHWALDVRGRALHYYDLLGNFARTATEVQFQALLGWWADESGDKLGARADS